MFCFLFLLLFLVYGDVCTKEDDSCFQLAGSDGTNSLRCSDYNTCNCLQNYVYVDGLCQFSGKI
jgi:hypothetical protein